MNIDPLSCPLCGDKNACGSVAKAVGKINCWCQASETMFPDELIQQVPPALRNKACICKNCAEKFNYRLARQV